MGLVAELVVVSTVHNGEGRRVLSLVHGLVPRIDDCDVRPCTVGSGSCLGKAPFRIRSLEERIRYKAIVDTTSHSSPRANGAQTPPARALGTGS